jgi:hypothetical protein
MTVSAEQRAALARAVSGLRRIFEADYAALAEGKFGIHLAGRRAGDIEDAAALSLSAHDLAARAELFGVIEYLRGEGVGARESVERMVREAVFTTVNRLLAIRVAEAIGVLPPSLADGIRSEGFSEAVEAFPLLRDADDSGGYWTYLQICGDELSHAVPRLFDRRHPLSALAPSAEALAAAVEILTEPALSGLWVEPEALGWSYQFFNSQDERRSMREASSAPRDSRELAVRNQFFTPGYVVDFLVQNTLGRRLRESGFDVELPLLLGDVDEGAAPIDLNDVAVLDPAVGSGHFLLGAYDLLERAWEEHGIGPDAAAPRIASSLHGIEIDPRAAQVAQAVIYLRARRSSPNSRLEPPAIVTARPLPRDPETRREVLSSQPGIVRDLVGELSTALENAPDLGSLLKVEDVVAGALGERVQRPQLGDDLAESIESVETAVIQTAAEIAHRADASPAERLFAAEAADALRFVEACAKRYDVVLMNPPFGEPIARTKDFIRTAWPWIPRKDHNVFAAFVSRGIELLKDSGYMGAITSRVGFFLTTFQQWRDAVVLPRLRTCADLGHGVMEDALVEAAAYVLSARQTTSPSHFVSLLDEAEKEEALRHPAGWRRFEIKADEFDDIPGSPIAYWLPPQLRTVFREVPALSDAHGPAKQGLITGDHFRFLRLWWEIDPAEIGQGAHWVPFAKGGEYRPYYTDVHLLVNWAEDGDEVRRQGRNARVQNVDYYFRPGVTWPGRTASSLSVGPLPEGCIFSDKGPASLAEDSPSTGWLTVMNSRVFRSLVDALMAAGEGTSSGTAARDYTVGAIGRIPSAVPMDPALSTVGLRVWDYHATRDQEEEISLRFRAYRSNRIDSDAMIPGLLDELADADNRVSGLYGLDVAARQLLDDLQGALPASYPESLELDERQFSEDYQCSIDALVDRAILTAEGGRHVAVKSYVLDRRIELLSHIYRCHPRLVVETVARLGLERPGRKLTESYRLVSYLLGCAFGRWDVRLADDASTEESVKDPFASLPSSPPGLLGRADHLHSIHGYGEYPLPVPPDGVLHDDEGHPWDVVVAMELAAQVASIGDRQLGDALRCLGADQMRLLLRDRFFALHLSRYSKSRRKAPIYWYLAVPSRDWGLWVYAPWLSREQLFAVSRAAQERFRRLSDQSAQLRRDLEAGRERGIHDRLEATEDLMRELEVFHKNADLVAQSGWEPDLNDGIILNAAPLEDLFADARWRKDVSTHRKKLEKGEYPWATVQRQYFDRLKT